MNKALTEVENFKIGGIITCISNVDFNINKFHELQ